MQDYSDRNASVTSTRAARSAGNTDATTAARRSTFVTPHGAVEMPAFMPVGTVASVKGLESEQLRGTGAQIVLANTYHLALRPGEEVVASPITMSGVMFQ